MLSFAADVTRKYDLWVQMFFAKIQTGIIHETAWRPSPCYSESIKVASIQEIQVNFVLAFVRFLI